LVEAVAELVREPALRGRQLRGVAFEEDRVGEELSMSSATCAGPGSRSTITTAS
jgi:hypothetical protein